MSLHTVAITASLVKTVLAIQKRRTFSIQTIILYPFTDQIRISNEEAIILVPGRGLFCSNETKYLTNTNFYVAKAIIHYNTHGEQEESFLQEHGKNLAYPHLRYCTTTYKDGVVFVATKNIGTTNATSNLCCNVCC